MVSPAKSFTYYADKKSWEEARISCLDRGLQLAVIHSKSENDALRDALNDHECTINPSCSWGHEVWIGLTDEHWESE